MKIAICGDQHWTDRKPQNRIDDYYQTLKNKVRWELEIAYIEDCRYVIFPGDVFDSYKTNYNVVADMIMTIRRAERQGLKFLYTFGQHDVRYHSTEIGDTPLGVLLAGTNGILLGAFPVVDDGVCFYGAGWGEPMPNTKPDMFNILVTHRMVVEDGPLWPGQTEFTTAEALTDIKEYNVFICGDNHKSFTFFRNNKLVVNMGSLMRTSTAQTDHYPGICIFDTDTHKYEVKQVPSEIFRPSMEIFALEEIQTAKEEDAKIAAFVQSLNNLNIASTNFSEALQLFIKNNNLADNVLHALDVITNKEKTHG